MHLYRPSTETNCSQHKPRPKLLSERDRKNSIKLHVLIGLLILFAVTCLATAVALLTLARIVNSNREDPSLGRINQGLIQALYQGPEHSDASCNIATSDSAAQQFFMVDLPVYFRTKDTPATYADAKVIDMSWNLIFGQGGRLLHGWLFCSYIVPDTFTLLLERSGMPYSALLDIFFACAAPKTLWSLCKMFGRWRRLPTIMWTFIALTYVLLFPTIWDAATGYFQPSKSVFEMPDGSYVSEGSSHLRACLVLNDTRLPVDPQVLVFERDEGISQPGSAVPEGLLLDIQHYADTMYSLRAASLLRCDQDAPRGTSGYYLTDGLSVNFTDFSVTKFGFFPFYGSLVSKELPSCGFATQASVSQICSPAQPNCKPSSVFDYYFNNKTNVLMTLDPSATEFPAGTLPYNSSIWMQGTNINLTAPTLDLMGDCFSDDGEYCKCYDSQPIKYNYTTPEHTQCLSVSGYSWGFSTGVAILAISLEIAWIIGCYGVWLDAQLNSKLVRRRRRAAGEVRTILDFAARINHDLGTDTVECSEKELRQALEKCGDVGHSLGGKDHDGEPAIGILAARKASPTRNRFWRLKRRPVRSGVEHPSGENSLTRKSDAGKHSSESSV